MKATLIFLLILISVFIVLFFNFQKNSRIGEASGLVEGKLSKCSKKPNCVCSEHVNDTSHYIEPIIIPTNGTVDIFTLLKTVILEMGGNIQVESDNYLSATFTSAIFKFVDDLEIRIDLSQKVIHIRSASRVGYSDMGVNKKRTELLKNLFRNKVSETNKLRQLTP